MSSSLCILLIKNIITLKRKHELQRTVKDIYFFKGYAPSGLSKEPDATACLTGSECSSLITTFWVCGFIGGIFKQTNSWNLQLLNLKLLTLSVKIVVWCKMNIQGFLCQIPDRSFRKGRWPESIWKVISAARRITIGATCGPSCRREHLRPCLTATVKNISPAFTKFSSLMLWV